MSWRPSARASTPAARLLQATMIQQKSRMEALDRIMLASLL
jgi:hypothetical protein